MERAGAQRRRRRRRGRRGRGGARSPSSTSRTSRARSTDWACADQRDAAPRRSPRTACACYDVRARDRRRWPTPARCSSCAATSGSGWSPRSPASRAGRSASSPTTRRTSPARSTPTAPTRRRASCSCATRSTSRSCSSCDTPGIMVGPEVEETALVRHCQPAVRHRRQPHRAVRHDRAAQGLRPRRAGDGRRQLPRRRCSCVAWPTGEFGGMGLEGAVRLGYRKRARGRSTTPTSASASFQEMVDRHVRARQGAEHRVALRDRRRHRPGRLPPVDHRRCSTSSPPPPHRAGKKRPNIDTW